MKPLLTIPTRVLRSDDVAATDAQRVSQAGFQRVNQAVDALNPLLTSPFGSGELLTQPDGQGSRTTLIDILAGDNDLPHNLGRMVQGFLLVDLQGRGDVSMYRIPVSRAFDQQSVRLHSAHNCSAKIWVW